MHEAALTVFPGESLLQASFKRDLQDLYSLFDDVARWLQPTWQRKRSIFARVIPKECMAGGDPVLQIMVNPDEVLVADQNSIDVAMEQFSYGLMDGVYFRAQKYWSTAVTLTDFRLREPDFDYPEILIPGPVTKAQISVYTK